ncbi:male-specific lethal 2-like protein [Elysia marginata]|uniref:Male-specific lethal 2-like protein n=1 Tax=Elysia marginata TaxID=1093978 RepID=A0AAV4JN61_9GAST|nr:male-specific lethal 2-like protein [Elysia marginata]
MDAYTFYVCTVRYVMNAKPKDKSSWQEIFRYLPTLRQMVSCCVCGNVALRPQGPNHNVCLHFVCEACKGGKMRLKPSCGWCKDQDSFVENKRARALINCFKRLCLYISSSDLGREILNASENGQSGEAADKVLKIIEEVGNFEDEITLTPPPPKMPKISKLVSNGFKPKASTTALISKASTSRSSPIMKRGRPPAMSSSMVTAQIRPKSNVAHHVKRLKKKALNTQAKKALNTQSKKASPGNISFPRKNRFNKSPTSNSPNFLITNRPHREKNGKYSIGQLWRETFLEEEHRDVIYPDSGIEVGNASDHDQCPQPSLVEPSQGNSKPESTNNVTEIPHKETRSQAIHLSKSKDVADTVTAKSEVCNAVEGSVNDEDNEENKPRLMLMISKKAIATHPSARRGMRSSITSAFVARKKSKTSELPLSRHNINKKGRALVSRQTRNVKPKTDNGVACRCARFKQPNQLTCFGQKCPCYSEKRACVECLCNGCKNPLHVMPDTAPPLMRFIRDSSDMASQNRSMPRLSPIPRA